MLADIFEMIQPKKVYPIVAGDPNENSMLKISSNILNTGCEIVDCTTSPKISLDNQSATYASSLHAIINKNAENPSKRKDRSFLEPSTATPAGSFPEDSNESNENLTALEIFGILAETSYITE